MKNEYRIVEETRGDGVVYYFPEVRRFGLLGRWWFPSWNRIDAREYDMKDCDRPLVLSEYQDYSLLLYFLTHDDARRFITWYAVVESEKNVETERRVQRSHVARVVVHKCEVSSSVVLTMDGTKAESSAIVSGDGNTVNQNVTISSAKK